MTRAQTILYRAYWGLTLLLLALALMAAIRAPVEASMGPIQKLFYLHLPVAMNTFLSAFVVFIASLGYVWGRRRAWDDLAVAAAKVTVLNGTVLLLTGMLWARVAWGHWWTWSPRLAFSLLLWLLYAAYLSFRPMIESPSRRAITGAVYGVLAFLDVPLVYLSVKLLPDIHPDAVELAPQMQLVLALWFVPVTMITGGLIAARYLLSQRAHMDPRLAHAELRPTGMVT
jgi:heme exporter protein C